MTHTLGAEPYLLCAHFDVTIAAGGGPGCPDKGGA
jgi:hypothetical protein